ncbi:DUF2243 domain-containing protein [Actinosynnema sp. NPDC047251]|uniref:Putative membrane protein n=1 Tax=Saccharothrix espanaensis (strain ATCC 51144 / DSM 44229 / JCM 9112 / NBRC 15066 / NRRL 15764) TaxID=1179773 RepID=K0JUB4_SACES|nr:DUF2243 domain-containing protein [Saccharothrix espanaensis]CCH29516.1 putative membrane protein [Saccharothrix espanaensis DSM 44229]
MKTTTRLRAPLVLGLGIGGFVDGIVIHQLLGWHHMLSGWYPLVDPHAEHVNMIGDGAFHLGCLVLVLVGVALLNRAGSLPARVLWGGVVAGWGVFNVVEGVVDHLLLGVHHVRHGPDQLLWDLGFLALGVLLIVGGGLLARPRSVTQGRPGGGRAPRTSSAGIDPDARRDGGAA